MLVEYTAELRYEDGYTFLLRPLLISLTAGVYGNFAIQISIEWTRMKIFMSREGNHGRAGRHSKSVLRIKEASYIIGTI